MQPPKLHQTLLRFCITGLTTAVIYLTICYLLVKISKTSAEIAGFIGFVAILPINYLLHKLWSFESKRFHRETAPKFLVVIVLGIIINSTAIHIFVTFGLHFLIAQVFAMSVVIIWNFGMFKWWVFPQNSSAP